MGGLEFIVRVWCAPALRKTVFFKLSLKLPGVNTFILLNVYKHEQLLLQKTKVGVCKGQLLVPVLQNPEGEAEGQ